MQNLKAQFDRDGYVVIREFWTRSEIQALARQIDRYLSEVSPRLAADDQFYEHKGQPETLKYIKAMSDHDNFFKRLLHGEPFAPLAESLLGDRALGQDLSFFNKPARIGKATPPHQDGYYFMLEPSEALTLWLAIDGADAQNGCIRYVPGSHRRGLRPHRRTDLLGFSQAISDYTCEDEKLEVAIEAQPGDLLIHHCQMIHRADPNRSDRSRRAVGFIYYAGRAKQDRERYLAYKRSVSEELSRSGKI